MDGVGVPVQVPEEDETVPPIAAVPERAGSTVLAGASVTILVDAEAAEAEPAELEAVTLTRKYFPASAEGTEYEAVAFPVPVAEVQPVEPLADTCH